MKSEIISFEENLRLFEIARKEGMRIREEIHQKCRNSLKSRKEDNDEDSDRIG